MTINQPTIDFQTVFSRVSDIAETESTQMICCGNQNEICRTTGFSEYGFNTLGKTVGFPAQFIREVDLTNPDLAVTIVSDRVRNYFDRKNPPFFTRSFNGEICGIVSNKYAYFDDDEVMDILKESPLASYAFQYALITPERLHLRAIDLDNPFKIDGDDSNLYMLYYIDNSMVGQSSFRVRIGVYRQICSNGMIVPLKSFVVCKAVHRGKMNIAEEFNSGIAFLSEKESEIKKLLSDKAAEDAAISDLKEDFQRSYIAKELNLSQKETEKVLNLYYSYSNEYGRKSKWAFINAVTEFARDIPEGSIEKRLFLESKAVLAA